ncbi:MAG: DUF3793 family protein [Monoglobaceae bacterium]
MSEELLVRHCSPTLAGMKTANMFSCSFNDESEMRQSIRNLNAVLVKKGLRVLPLKFQNNRALIYVYRPSKLSQDLKQDTACRLLKKYGYTTAKPERCIIQLMQRLTDSKEFPHEIGLFLGYPPEDVCGFIENKAEKCKYVGCWKVYGDVTKARKTFAKYKKCTKVYYEQWTKGKSIERLIVAV